MVTITFQPPKYEIWSILPETGIHGFTETFTEAGTDAEGLAVAPP